MRALIITILLMVVSACSFISGNRPDVDRVQDRTIEVGPPAAYLQCNKPVYLTKEQIDQLSVESELVEIYIIPGYKAHKACYENMQDIIEWEKKLNQ